VAKEAWLANVRSVPAVAETQAVFLPAAIDEPAGSVPHGVSAAVR
jgi:hypothetical protein